MKTAIVALLALAACSGQAPATADAPDLGAELDLAPGAAGDLAGVPGVDLAHADIAPAVDLAQPPADMAQCGKAGFPCCDSSQFDPAYCQDTRAGAGCSGTCGSGEVCRRDFNASSYGMPTCYPCGATGERCCSGNGCDSGRTCKVAGTGAYNMTCQP